MKGRPEELEVLAGLRPLDVTAYLRASGWVEVDPSDHGPLMAWEKPLGQGVADVLVPRHPSWRDYARCMRTLIETLSEVEDRPPSPIVRDISQVAVDVVRLRAVSTSADGTIPLADGVELAMAGRALLLAAACSAVRPRRAYHAYKPAQAEKFVGGLRLGQSERGSYILTILSPVGPAMSSDTPAEPPAGSSGQVEEPFARRAVRMLGMALERVRSAAERGVSSGELKAFEDAVAQGVSANLCEALSLVGASQHVNMFEVRIGWAPSRPVEASTPGSAVFTRDVLEAIREGGRLLRERSEIEGFELAGPVIQVNRPGEMPQGKAVIYGSVDGQPRKVSVELSGEAWNLAHQSLERRAAFRCTGELARAGKAFELKNPRDCELLLEED